MYFVSNKNSFPKDFLIGILEEFNKNFAVICHFILVFVYLLMMLQISTFHIDKIMARKGSIFANIIKTKFASMYLINSFFCRWDSTEKSLHEILCPICPKSTRIKITTFGPFLPSYKCNECEANLQYVSSKNSFWKNVCIGTKQNGILILADFRTIRY